MPGLHGLGRTTVLHSIAIIRRHVAVRRSVTDPKAMNTDKIARPGTRAAKPSPGTYSQIRLATAHQQGFRSEPQAALRRRTFRVEVVPRVWSTLWARVLICIRRIFHFDILVLRTLGHKIRSHEIRQAALCSAADCCHNDSNRFLDL